LTARLGVAATAITNGVIDPRATFALRKVIEQGEGCVMLF